MSRPSPLGQAPLPAAAIVTAPARILLDEWVNLARGTAGDAAEVVSIHARSYSKNQKAELLDHLMRSLEGGSLFASVRMIVLHDGRAMINEAPLKRWIASPSPRTTLLVTHRTKDRKDKLPAWKGVAIERVEDPGPATDRARATWLSGRAAERGCSLDGRTLRVLEEQIGDDLDALDAAIEKLSLYRLEGAITPDDIDALIGRSAGRAFDRLWDAMLAGEPGRALSLLEEAVEEGLLMFDGGRIHGRSAIAGTLMPLMLSRLRRSLALATAGKAREPLQKTWAMHPFYAKKLIEEADRLSPERQLQLLRTALAAEVLQKGVGSLRDADLLELWLAERGDQR